MDIEKDLDQDRDPQLNAEALADLIQACLDGRATETQAAQLNARLRADAAARDLYLQLADTHSCLAVDEQLWVGAPVVSARALTTTATAAASASALRGRPGRERWLTWRPLAAAAAGLVFGMLCTSVVFAYTQSRPAAGMPRPLPLADAGFESGTAVPAQGIPAQAGVWGGDFCRVVGAEQGITPARGGRMLRFLSADNTQSPGGERSYVGEVAQVIDLRALRAEMTAEEQVLEVSARFNSAPLANGAPHEFAVKVAAFRGDIANAPALWVDHDVDLSRSSRSVLADADAATWQRVAAPLLVPADADFLILECAVVLRGPQAAQGVAQFPGHYVDQVEFQVGSSAGRPAGAPAAD